MKLSRKMEFIASKQANKIYVYMLYKCYGGIWQESNEIMNSGAEVDVEEKRIVSVLNVTMTTRRK